MISRENYDYIHRITLTTDIAPLPCPSCAGAVRMRLEEAVKGHGRDADVHIYLQCDNTICGIRSNRMVQSISLLDSTARIKNYWCSLVKLWNNRLTPKTIDLDDIDMFLPQQDVYA